MLTELGIKPIKNSKNLGYNYKKTAKDLYDIFKSKNWIDECIDVINEDNNIEISEDEILAEDLYVDKSDKSVNIKIEDHVDLINGFERQMNNLKEYLFANYDKDLMPISIDGKPINISVAIGLNQITNLVSNYL